MPGVSRRNAIKIAAGIGGAGALALAGWRASRWLSDGHEPVVIVGGGASALAAARTLLNAGIDTLIISAGPFTDAAAARLVPTGVPDEPYEKAAEGGFEWVRTRLVGGKLVHWGRHCPRYSRSDLESARELDSAFEWPIPYDELAAYYPDVERWLGVTGRAEGLVDVPDGVFSPHRLFHPVEEQMAERLRSHGVLVTPGRMSVGFDVVNAFHRLARSSRCGIIANATVLRLEHDAVTNRVRAVTYYDEQAKRETSVRARHVMVAAGALESAQLLLNSRSERYPDGLGNASGTLGRYLVDHIFVIPYVHLDKDIPDLDAHAFIPRVSETVFPRRAGVFGGIQLEFRPRRMEADRLELKFHCYAPMRPSKHNRIELTGRVTTKGVPIPRIHCVLGDADLALHSHMVDVVKTIFQWGFLQEPGVYRMAPGAAIHQAGVCRMGRNPQTSMLTGFCESHEVKGLYAVDASAFPFMPEKNPTLTIMAVATRAAKHLVDALA